MARLSLIGAISLAALLSACASAPPRDARTLQTTGAAPYRNYWREGDAVFVRVQAGSPDALLLAEPEPWAETLALLEYGQRLTVLDERRGNFVSVRTWGLGVEVEGWVARSVVGTHIPKLGDAEQRELEEEGAALSKTICSRLPGDDPMDSSAVDRALARIDEHESDRNRLLGGDALNPDPAITRERFRAFGEQGGLMGD